MCVAGDALSAAPATGDRPASSPADSGEKLTETERQQVLAVLRWEEYCDLALAQCSLWLEPISAHFTSDLVLAQEQHVLA